MNNLDHIKHFPGYDSEEKKVNQEITNLGKKCEDYINNISKRRVLWQEKKK